MTITTPPLAYVIEQERGANPRRGPMAECVIAIDPGETTGVAIMLQDNLIQSLQIKTPDLERLDDLVEWLRVQTSLYKVDSIVIEDYRVFSWKSKQHEWSSLHTPKLIGALRMWSGMAKICVVMQTPQVAKGFVTDQKLKDWDLWAKGQKHARDAIRHAIYFQIFGSVPK